MQLTFSPALGQATTVKVPPARSNAPDTSTQVIQFEATFDSHESYVKAKSDGVKVELWTDLPLAPHTGSRGGWAAANFTESEADQDDRALDSPGLFSLSTQGGGEVVGSPREAHKLSLKLRLPFQDHIGSRFQFTYRLVYPSGHIYWMGSHDSNGTVVVERGLPGLTLAKEWEVGEDGRYHIKASPHGGMLYEPESVDAWSLWVWRSGSIPTRLAGTEPTLVQAALLLPHPSAGGIGVAQPLIVLSKGESLLYARPDGGISVSSPDAGVHVVMGLLEYSRDLLAEAVSLCQGSQVVFDASTIAVVSRISDQALPLHVLYAPVSARRWSRLSLHQTLSQTEFPSVGEGWTLFSPTLRTARVVPAPLSEDAPRITFDSSGGELVISPVHVVSDSEKTWRVSLLAPHSGADITVERLSKTHSLPTPPPSPPVAQFPALSTPIPSQEGLDHPSGSATPLARPSSRRNTEHRRRASLTLVRNLPARLLRAYLHTVFNVVIWFWSVFLKAFVARIVGEGISRRVSSLLGFALSITAPRNRGLAGDSKRIQAPDTAKQLEPRSEAQSTSSVIASLSIPRPQHVTTWREPIVPRVVSRVLLSARALYGHRDSPYCAILQGMDAVKELRATIDGTPLPLSSTPIELGSGTYLVEIPQWLENGHFEISFDCL